MNGADDQMLESTLLRLEALDRQRLGEVLRVLLNHGSILGLEPSQTDLYHWAWANRPWIEEIGALFDLQLSWENEMRLLQAVPRSGAFLLRLKLDATLVLLTLWYEFDADIERTLIQSVAAGLGVALLPDQAKKLPHERVVFRELNPPVITESCIAWKADNPSTALKAYLNILGDRGIRMR